MVDTPRSRASTVDGFMTPAPHGISPDESLATAAARLREHRIRHLPVRSGGHVVGVLAERDLEMLQATGAFDLTSTPVERLMTPDPYCVAPSTPLSDVAMTMAERRIGSALVVDDGGRLLGIFTATDALRALSEMARRS